jgi:hypothetical protein
VTQRDIRDPQRLRQPTTRLIAQPSQTNSLATELLRIRRSRSGHLNLTFPGLSTGSAQVSSKTGQLHLLRSAIPMAT